MVIDSMTKEIDGEIRDRARQRIREYFYDPDFLVAQQLIEGNSADGTRDIGNGLSGVLLDEIHKDLKHRRIGNGQHPTQSYLESIVDTASLDVADFVGEVFHIGKQIPCTNYDATIEDVVKLLRIPLNVLSSVNNAYAANFIRRLCILMDSETKTMSVAEAITTLLPYISFKYRKSDHREMALDAFIDYVNSAIQSGGITKQGEVLIRDFNSYFNRVRENRRGSSNGRLTNGPQGASGYKADGQPKPNGIPYQITTELVSELLRKHKQRIATGDYNEVLIELEEKAGRLRRMRGYHRGDWHGQRDTLSVVVGTEQNSRSFTLSYAGQPRDPVTRNLFLHMGKYILGKHDLPPADRNETAFTLGSIKRHFMV